ncbi:MAG: 8-oxo-dGTP diphosphatase MutT [Rhodobiaceae bacterium]|nr:8-oxo-dGTP diphosphatase MutT [Rhodobiaceae bacterium]|tara:strand:- start:7482 stop:7880 length:399 start_codon:yes stop_codon:yes gene_type:complete
MIIKHVVACALADKTGRVLINQRPVGKDFEGYWEFPGGKIEEGETPESAIIRELKEEINIDVSASCLAPLSFSEMMYTNFYVVVLLYVCRKWDGYIQPQENQKIEWIQPKDIHKYKVLPADKSFFAVLRDLL